MILNGGGTVYMGAFQGGHPSDMRWRPSAGNLELYCADNSALRKDNGKVGQKRPGAHGGERDRELAIACFIAKLCPNNQTRSREPACMALSSFDVAMTVCRPIGGNSRSAIDAVDVENILDRRVNLAACKHKCFPVAIDKNNWITTTSCSSK